MCDVLLELGKEGASKAEMAEAINVARPTMDAWIAKHPEFSYAVERALQSAQAWWERKGRIATFDSSGFSAPSYAFNMKNRFPHDWRDKQEVENTHDVADPLRDFFASVASASGRVGQ